MVWVALCVNSGGPSEPERRRYWCKRLCPIGGFLGIVGALSHFIKQMVNDE